MVDTQRAHANKSNGHAHKRGDEKHVNCSNVPDADADPNPNTMSLSAEQCAIGLFHTMKKLWIQNRRTLSVIMHELGGSEFLDAVATWCVQHPDMAICVLAACLVFLLPLFIMFGIGITTMLITFTGILVLEGTLMTVIFMIVFACIGCFTVSVAVFVVIAYFGFAQIYGFFGIDRHRDSFIKFVQQNRRVSDGKAGIKKTEPPTT